MRVADPALAFSIPKQPASLDDGLLAESEIAQLKRCADGGSLACNTIAGEPPVAEPLRLAMLDDINEASDPGMRVRPIGRALSWSARDRPSDPAK